MEEAAFLVAMDRIVGGIQVEDDPRRWPWVGVQEQRDEQALDRPRVVADLVIAIEHLGRCVFQPIQRALAGERGTVGAPGLQLADQGREHRIVAQLVVIDEILVAQRDPDDPLHEQGLDAVLDQLRAAPVDEAPREPAHQIERPVGSAQQQGPGVRGHRAAIERRDHLAPLDRFISEQLAATLCRHRGLLRTGLKSLSQRSYRRSRTPMHLLV